MAHVFRPSRTIAFLFGFALLAASAQAALVPPVPKLDVITPDSLQRGAPTVITLSGVFFDESARVVLVPDTGVTAKVEKPGKDGRILKVAFTAAADAPLGERELRVITAGGASNGMLLNIGRFPVVMQKAPINKIELAQKIDLPVALIGTIGGSGDIDYYKFAAKKGDFLVFEVFANRRGSTLDASLRLLNAAGKELVRDEDSFGLDPLVRYHFQEDGEYLVEIKDVRMQGSGNHRYRIEGGPLPYIESIFPLGGTRGQTVDVALQGYNLGDNPKVSLKLDATGPLGVRQISTTTPLGVSNSIPFEVSDLPEIAEAEPNNVWAQATSLPAPGNASGVIHAAHEVDRYKFKASGPTLVFEITASRHNSPLDALLMLTDVNGNLIAQDDDTAAGADARITANLQKDAEYIISVRDLHDRGGPNFTYRLSIAPPKPVQPNFAVRFTPDVPRVTRGGHAKIWCEVTRQNGFAGDVTVNFEGLPKGVTCEPFVLPGAVPTSGIFTLGAAGDAEVGTFPVKLVATGAAGEQKLTRNGQPEVANRIVRQAYIAVIDNPPFTLELVEAGADDLQKLDAEVAELQKKLDAPGPEVAAAQTKWETSDAVKGSWVLIDPEKMISSAYAGLAKQPDGSILVSGTNPAKDMYKLIVKTPLKGITAFRLEALADVSLGGGGPGRAANGNFVLTNFKVDAAPSSNENSITAVRFKKATADFSQDGFSAERALLNDPNAGWAIYPEVGKSHTAVFECADPVGFDGGTTLTITLDHNSPHVNHIIGKFRLSVTQGANPAGGAVLPGDVRAALDVPADKRNDAQKAALAKYYHGIDPSLQKIRGRMTELKAMKGATFPPQLSKAKGTDLVVMVRRRADFHGDVTISLEGYSAGREANTQQPTAIAKDIDVKPVVVKGTEIAGVLHLKAQAQVQEGTRTAVVRGEIPDSGQIFAQYSKALPVSIGGAPVKKLGNVELAAQNVKYPQPGIKFKYFEGDWDLLPEFPKLKAAKEGIATTIGVEKKGRPEMYGFQFIGYVDIPKDGEYTFHLGSDDGSALYLQDQLAISHDGLHGLDFMTVKVKMKAGLHGLRVDFFQKAGGDGLELHWEGPDIAKQPVPAARLFHTK